MKSVNLAGSCAPLLLTATVAPQVSGNLKLASPEIRASQYKLAIEQWCRSGFFKKIVICENSNYQESVLITGTVIEKFKKDGGVIEYLTFLPESMSNVSRFGKGYGEMEIIKHAVSESLLIRNAGFFTKCTGRLFVKNSDHILNSLNLSPNFAICANLSMMLKFCDSRFFICSVDFFEKYLVSKIDRLCDSEGRYFEKILAMGILNAIANDMRWSVPVRAPWYEGQSGSVGIKYKYPLSENIAIIIKKHIAKW